MGGGGNLPDNMRGRFKPYGPYNRNRNKRGRHNDRRAGGESYLPPLPRQTKDGEPMWYKIVVPHGRKFGKDFILREINARISVPFVPYNFQYDGSYAVFFLNDPASATAIRSLNRAIDTPSGFKLTILLKNSEMPTINLTDDIVEKLKLVMAQRYDGVRQHLDLSQFHEEAALKQANMFVPLYRTSILTVAVKVVLDNVPEVQSIDLSQNKLAVLHPLEPLHSKCTNLRSLNLSTNKIRKITELDCLKGMAIQELILDSNPVCDAYSDQSSYIR